jgi:hypothetical protein
MKTYLGVKKVKAMPMTKNEAGAIGLVRGYSKNDLNMDGYKVVREDGYESWSPKETFEKAYREIKGLTFGMVLEALKSGMNIRRAGWSKGVYASLDPNGILVQIPVQYMFFDKWISSAELLANDWEIVE